METSEGTIIVRPVMCCGPVWFTPDYWSESTHLVDGITETTPLDEKPWAEFEVSLDVELGDVHRAALDAWEVRLGPEQLRYRADRIGLYRSAFVKHQDETETDKHLGYPTSVNLQIAREDRTVEAVLGSKATYRDLLASSSLGLIEGDVTRPYVHPNRPQGAGGVEADLARLTLEAIQAAYRAVDKDVGIAQHTLRLIRASWPNIKRTTETVVNDEMLLAGAASQVVGVRKWMKDRRRPKGDDPNIDRP